MTVRTNCFHLEKPTLFVIKLPNDTYDIMTEAEANRELKIEAVITVNTAEDGEPTEIQIDYLACCTKIPSTNPQRVESIISTKHVERDLNGFYIHPAVVYAAKAGGRIARTFATTKQSGTFMNNALFTEVVRAREHWKLPVRWNQERGEIETVT